MATRFDFKRVVRDAAQLEDSAEIAIGTTAFSGDGDRLFLQHNGIGLLLHHNDARAFLRAAKRAADRLDLDLEDAENP